LAIFIPKKIKNGPYLQGWDANTVYKTIRQPFGAKMATRYGFSSVSQRLNKIHIHSFSFGIKKPTPFIEVS
jgi:hypothetical protein